MKLYALPFVVVLTAATCLGSKISVTRVKRPSLPQGNEGNRLVVRQSDNTLDISSVHDLIYMANITLGGIEYIAQIDTGSSDLWIQGQTSPLPNSTPTSMTLNLTYPIGWAYGQVSHTPVEFVGINVASQAFLDIKDADNPALGHDANGIVGLGFTSLSTIDASMSKTGSSAGRSLLFNMFQENLSEPNFLAFSLQRVAESNGDDAEGTFSIGEYEPQYSAVQYSTAVATWPVHSPARWNVLLDALFVGEKVIIPTTGVPKAPKAVILLDSGSSWTYAPKEICDAIYAGVDGARFDASLGQWIVPCSAEIDVAFQIGGDVFPLHPLDIAPTSLTDRTVCVGTFIPQPIASAAHEFDWLVGDNFLRSVYAVYDFGDFDSKGNMGDPYVKLLSLVQPPAASQEFCKARGCQAKSNITYESVNTGFTSVTLSMNTADSLEQLGKYFPIILAVLGLNALVFIILIVFGVVHLCKRRRRGGATVRATRGRMSPMPMNPRNSYIAGISSTMSPSSSQPQHTYEPVSMALTEDTLFVPPSPAFFEGSKMHPGDRPKSMA